MILKYTRYGEYSQTVVDGVTRVNVEYVNNHYRIEDVGLERVEGEIPSDAVVSYRRHGDDDLQQEYCKPGFVFLMNDSGKTIDKF